MTRAMVSQVGIAIFGVSAVLCTQLDPQWHKWASVLGLAGQPFWFYSSWTTRQLGIFALSWLYTISWTMGLVKYWF